MTIELGWLQFDDAGAFSHAPTRWRLHAVFLDPAESFQDLRGRKSLCGRTPKHGYTLDVFIDDKCVQCLRAAGIACVRCKGVGSLGAPSYQICKACLGKKEMLFTVRRY